MSMKFLLTVYICSAMSGDCYTNPDYPKVYDDHHDCIRAGLSESYEIIYAENNFTKEQFESLKNKITDIQDRYEITHIIGHRDVDDRKECPSFDVGEWAKDNGLV